MLNNFLVKYSQERLTHGKQIKQANLCIEKLRQIIVIAFDSQKNLDKDDLIQTTSKRVDVWNSEQFQKLDFL